MRRFYLYIYICFSAHVIIVVFMSHYVIMQNIKSYPNCILNVIKGIYFSKGPLFFRFRFRMSRSARTWFCRLNQPLQVHNSSEYLGNLEEMFFSLSTECIIIGHLQLDYNVIKAQHLRNCDYILTYWYNPILFEKHGL